ncbi:MAG: hypothetical protein J1E05_02790 [Eubacterium sp.]|nr:hypothetical protein [Eubacterium sp.]
MIKKEIQVIIIAFAMLFGISLFVGIIVENNSYTEESNNEPTVDDVYDTATTEVTTVKTTTEPLTQQVNLSESCDKILASGLYDGDYYELVATQEETYNEVVIKIGVIKNNEWLIPLTTDSPFINEDGRLFTYNYYDHNMHSNSTKNLEFVSDDYNFIGNGCFYIYTSSVGNIIYNAEIDKELVLPKSAGAGVNFYRLHFEESLDEYVCSDKFIIEYYKDSSYQDVRLLDTNTMEMKIIIENPDYNVVGPLVDGLFAMGYSYSDSVNAFYDINGKKILDVSEYKIHYTRDTYGKYPYFENGQFKFVTTNEAGTKYDMIIEKTGKVIESVER